MISNKEWKWYLLIALGLAFYQSIEFFILGPFSWIYGYGASLETLPVHLGLHQTGSTYSFWAPFIGGGVDRLSFWGNSDPFNLEPLLISAFPVWLANAVHAFGQRLVAVLFTALVCREQLGLSKNLATLAGIFHACFSYYTFGAMFTSPALPLVLWLLNRTATSKHPLLLSALVGLGCTLFTTFVHGIPYWMLFLLLWFGLVCPQRQLKFWLSFAVFLIVLTVGEIPQLWALLVNASFSQRQNIAVEQIAWSIPGLFYYQPEYDFFNQDKLMKILAIGIPWLFIIVGFVSCIFSKQTQKWKHPFVILSLVYAFFSLKILFVGGQQVAGLWFPWIKGVYMGRFFMVPYSFLVSAVGASCVGLISEQLTNLPKLKRSLVIGMGILIFVILTWPKISLYYPLMIDSWGQKNYEVQALEVLKQQKKEPFRVASVLDLQPSYAYAQGLETVDGWSNLYPAVYRELWLKVIEPLMNRLPRNREIFDPAQGKPQDNYIFLGTGFFIPNLGILPGENTTHAIQNGFDISRRFNLNLLSLLNVKYILSEYPLLGKGLSLHHSLTPNPQHPLSKDYATGLVNGPRNHLPKKAERANPLLQLIQDTAFALKRKTQGKDLFIYENKNVLPRFRLVNSIVPLASGKEVLDRLATASTEELSQTAFVESSDWKGGPKTFSFLGENQINLLKYSNDEIILQINIQKPAFLVLAMTWNPYWIAEIEGKEQKFLRINHAQMGLKISGSCKVHIKYRPPYLLKRLASKRMKLNN